MSPSDVVKERNVRDEDARTYNVVKAGAGLGECSPDDFERPLGLLISSGRHAAIGIPTDGACNENLITHSDCARITEDRLPGRSRRDQLPPTHRLTNSFSQSIRSRCAFRFGCWTSGKAGN
jgi:hypothetical protein